MRKGIVSVALFLVACSLSAAPAEAPLWSEEGNGAAGASPDPKLWNYDLGGWGWGNNELQSYTDRPANARYDGQGHLVITALKEKFTGKDGKACAYTSARLLTKGKFDFKYGRVEARLQLPRGQGLWPAFWMLGADIDKSPWPACGEIDVMEHVGQTPLQVYGSLHGPGYSAMQHLGGAFDLPAGTDADFHVYAAEWRPDRIAFSCDGKIFKTLRPRDLPRGSAWVFDKPFFIILNLAVGGYWPGQPDASTPFPASMLVDYVRVYR